MRDNDGNLVAENINRSFKEIWDDQKEALRKVLKEMYLKYLGFVPSSEGIKSPTKVAMKFPPHFPNGSVKKTYSLICRDMETKNKMELLVHSVHQSLKDENGSEPSEIKVLVAMLISQAERIGYSPTAIDLEVKRQLEEKLRKWESTIIFFRASLTS